MDVIQSRIERGELTFNATLADALAGYGFAFAPNRKTAVADLMRFTDAESGNAFKSDNPNLFEGIAELYILEDVLGDDVIEDQRYSTLTDEILAFPLRRFYRMDKEKPGVEIGLGETHKRLAYLILDSLGIKLGHPIFRLFDEAIRLTKQEQKQADEQSEAHKTAEKLSQLAQGQDTLAQKQDALRHDFANLGDEVYDAVGRERIPPKREEIDDHSRRELYELVKRIKAKTTGKRGALDDFMDASTWRFRGFTVREIYKDTTTLNKFYHAERMAIKREQERGNS